MNERDMPDRSDITRRAATLSLPGVVAAVVAIFAPSWLPTPWSIDAAVVACAAAAACVGAAVSLARNSRDGAATAVKS